MHSLEELMRSGFLALIPFLIIFCLAFAFGPTKLWEALWVSIIVLMLVIIIAAWAGKEGPG